METVWNTPFCRSLILFSLFIYLFIYLFIGSLDMQIFNALFIFIFYLYFLIVFVYGTLLFAFFF